MNYYVISIFNNDKQEQQYLATDEHSGGYPYWSSGYFRVNTYESSNSKSMIDTLDRIKTNFKQKRGEYFKTELDPSTLRIWQIGVVSSILVDILEETESEKAQRIFQDLKTKLSPEELAILGNEKFQAIVAAVR